MAKIIRKGKDLEREYLTAGYRRKKGGKAYLIYLAASVLFLAVMFLLAKAGNEFASGNFNMFLAALVVIAIIWLFIYIDNIWDIRNARTVKKNILAAGIKGEKQTANLLSFLPKGYTVYQDVKVPFNEKTSEIDNIVVGKKRVYIIETKNLNGDITGSVEDTYWTQSKVGRRGTQYCKEFYSPVKQVGTHIYRLANYLRANGANVYVKGMVYFTNEDSTVRIKGKKNDIKVYSSHEGDEPNMYNDIIFSDGEISPAELKHINALISKL